MLIIIKKIEKMKAVIENRKDENDTPPLFYFICINIILILILYLYKY